MKAGTARSAERFDLIIVGGGMVGASLAMALASTTKRVAVIEPVLPGADTQPSFDDRTSALANGSRRILATIGVWQGIAPHAAPISSIHVSDAGHFGSAQIDAAEQGLEALGYTVANRRIGAALWERLQQQSNIAVYAPARVTDVRLGAEEVRAELVDVAGVARTLRASLVVAADGAQSLVRQVAGITVSTVDYRQVAIVANLSAERSARGVAFERFTPAGPLALLPLADGSYTVVWTVADEAAPALLVAGEQAFLSRLQQCFGWRVGALQRLGRRAAYPLALTRASRSVAMRTALVGNAAQALHPVAGQGFNLGLRDAAVLAELIAAASDVGAPQVLEEYERQRSSDRRGMIVFTDNLVRLFALQRPGAAELRSLGLSLFDAAPFAKRTLSRLSWGFGFRTPRLLRGLPLV